MQKSASGHGRKNIFVIMPRRVRWWSAAILIACGVPAALAQRSADPRPNIVFMLLDNIGQEWFGCYGSEEKCTPNIDRLAASSVRFANCYTTTVCGPSLSYCIPFTDSSREGIVATIVAWPSEQRLTGGFECGVESQHVLELGACLGMPAAQVMHLGKIESCRGG